MTVWKFRKNLANRAHTTTCTASMMAIESSSSFVPILLQHDVIDVHWSGEIRNTLITLFECPDRLSNLAVEEFGRYVSDLFVQLATFPESTEIQEIDQHNLEQTCKHLEDLISTTVPSCLANEVTARLLNHLDKTYKKLRWTAYIDWIFVVFILNREMTRILYWRKNWEYKDTVHQSFIDFKKAYDSVKRELLYDILIEFGIPKKLVRLIKMCLSEMYSRVRIEKNKRIDGGSYFDMKTFELPRSYESNDLRGLLMMDPLLTRKQRLDPFYSHATVYPALPDCII
ncbi:hypothetical protein ANN_19589 [Periplaneta americana]|uniref:Reverse transcriptase domain-containing protein n=1 Tax=Periplaneta americana TaxID=6978 RepID=A0ABQ8SAY7_PERAM|nr:hypothetical protein ANN_19589 [Periplaneta americana]